LKRKAKKEKRKNAKKEMRRKKEAAEMNSVNIIAVYW